jgi:translation initiation factor IF-1
VLSVGSPSSRVQLFADFRRTVLDPLELDGVVAEQLPNAMYRVVLNDAKRSSITAHVGTQSLLRLRPGDHVVVELSPYDQTRGRVVRKVQS